jgi:hypothetical protein
MLHCKGTEARDPGQEWPWGRAWPDLLERLQVGPLVDDAVQGPARTHQAGSGREGVSE